MSRQSACQISMLPERESVNNKLYQLKSRKMDGERGSYTSYILMSLSSEAVTNS